MPAVGFSSPETLTDDAGNTLKGVTVAVAGPSSYAASAVSDAVTGVLILGPLPVGAYTITYLGRTVPVPVVAGLPAGGVTGQVPTLAADGSASWSTPVSTGGSAATTTFTPTGGIAASDVQAALVELDAEKQPVDSDLTAIAALTTTAYGRALLTQADAVAGRTNLGLGTAATANKVVAGVAGVLDATDATTTNARTPSGAAGGDLAGTFPSPTLAADRITKATLTAKGSIIAATAPATPTGLVVGTDGQVLTADASSAAGVKWAVAGGGTAPTSPIRVGSYYGGLVDAASTRAYPVVGNPEWHMTIAYISSAITVDALALNVTTAAAGGLIRMGLYAIGSLPTAGSASTGLTTTLLADAGQVDCSTTGSKVATFTAVVIPAGTTIGLLAAIQAGTGMVAKVGSSTGGALLGSQIPGYATGLPDVTLRQFSGFSGACPASLGQAQQWDATTSPVVFRRSA